MIPRRRLLTLAALGMLAGSAAASPESEKLFHDGRDLLKAGKIPEACEAFAASQRLEAKVGTLLNLADCREKQGRTATAASLFIEAKQLAAAQRDPRQAEAEKRATAIQGKLSYLTITVAPERQRDGLVIKRNGLTVDRAQWNTPVALDPGDYVVEVSAPKSTPWSTTRALGAKQKVEVVVEALPAVAAVEPAAPGPGLAPAPAPGAELAPEGRGERPDGPETQPGGPPAVATPGLPDPPMRPYGVGLVVGASSDQDALLGARVSGGVAVPHGALRAIGSLLYTSIDGEMQTPEFNTKLYALGISVDYVWMPLPQLAFGAGLGLGMDVAIRNHDRGNDTSGWGTLRLSPVILRVLDGRLEAGLHGQYVRTSDRGVFLGLAAIDLFPL
jgi:hypothetical protein